MSTPFLRILLVDDSPGDIALMEEAFKEWRYANDVSVVEDGEQALQFLRQEGPYVGAPRPDLVLLDLNLPKRDGREVLREIKSSPDLRDIPVVILTTSNAEQDVSRAYHLHANCYLTKPLDPEEFINKLRAVEDFWALQVRLPQRG